MWLWAWTCTAVWAQDAVWLRAQGTQIQNGLGQEVLLRGMGLGGWMVQEGYMLQTQAFANPQHEIKAAVESLIGAEATQAFYEAWLQNHVREADIDSLHAWGFNSVRVPLHYNLFTLPIEEEPVPGEHTWLDLGFDLTDSLVAWCKERSMYVVLDLHAAPGGQGYDAAISDYDSSKPSLWESAANRNKMASLWKRVAAHYADEPWVAGYDVLNEPNWNLPGGTALRDLYEQCTDSIREVDTEHLLFFEGNWFANDFTGLTPPWDSNMVYSPHKYWSNNDEATLDFALALRDAHQVPLYLGEAGENSNVWFRDAVRLLEDLEIGWAWWPLKKVESISAPMSIEKTAGYQALLDHWAGNAPAPEATFAQAVLMDLTDRVKAEHCLVQPDVVDALMRQPHTDVTLPFPGTGTIPGTVFAPDYDLGRAGIAYLDEVDATYHVSSGSFTAWNNGWTGRNDGVDIESCSGDFPHNGRAVGWTQTGEWMKYTVDVAFSGVYDFHIWVASNSGDGALRIEVDGLDVSGDVNVPDTGGWDTWTSVTVEDVVLFQGTQELVLHTVSAGHNVASMDVQWTGETPPNLQFIPGVIQAEAYLEQLGTGLEATTDVGGGQNVGYLDAGDYLGYHVEVESAGPHVVTFRTASESTDGRLSMQLVDSEGNIHALGEFEFAATGGWQVWSTAEFDVDLPVQGVGLLQLSVLDAPFNLNWLSFERVVEGCTYPWACNFDPLANLDDGSCNLGECAGCTYAQALNFSSAAQLDDGSCVFSENACPEDIDGDSAVTTSDLLALLAAFGDGCAP
jgi:hypothetical protein